MTDPNAPPPAVLALCGELFADIKERFVDYFLGGLPVGLIMMPVAMVGVFLLYGGMFGGMGLGIAVDDEDVMLLGMLAGMVGGLGAMLLLIVAVTAPLNASLARAMARHLAGEETLTLSAPFSTATKDLGKVYGFVVVNTVVGLFLMLFCYIPGLLWWAMTDFAWCRVVLDEESPVDAIRGAIGHAIAHPLWHLGYVGILFAGSMVVSYLPLVGTFLAPSMVAAWRVYAYQRAVRGEPALTNA